MKCRCAVRQNHPLTPHVFQIVILRLAKANSISNAWLKVHDRHPPNSEKKCMTAPTVLTPTKVDLRAVATEDEHISYGALKILGKNC
jgi:hypothetical protein